ncbi:ankyrin repeat domain-containing protein 45 [Strongylocentrotus purpuratus]|uniref:Ankyrin repeat domain-containing protein 45 n=1 Tax=Strongylocentrotus purpuratus TaxID=7668 RepID=A0A7M7T4J6_STRPU|nr:ankyrin repeat domain-containing protein 45 [Strongylocentrotus purpuratus]
MTVDGERAESVASNQSGKRSGKKRLNIVIQCAASGDTSRLLECFANEEDPYHDRVESQLNSADEEGRSPVEIAVTENQIEMLKLLQEKGSGLDTRNSMSARTPLDMACILGRNEALKALLAGGADANNSTKRGYTAIHHAAAWGRMDCLKTLVKYGASLTIKTKHGERARDTALRYKHEDCSFFLDWSEARRGLVSILQETKETIEDPQKLQGRLAKDEKMTGLNVCGEKQEWLDSNPNASIEDFHKQEEDLRTSLEAILVKLSEPPPEKPHRR